MCIRDRLFDLNKDPMEINDLSKDSSQSELIDELRIKLLQAKEEYGDNLLPFSSFWDGF